MAKVLIKLKDKNDGTIDVCVEFNPPLKDNEELTAVQNLAFDFLESLKPINEDKP